MRVLASANTLSTALRPKDSSSGGRRRPAGCQHPVGPSHRLPVGPGGRGHISSAPRSSEERIAVRVTALGFADVGVYLADRVVQQGWLLAEVAAELAAHRVTVRRLLDRYGIRRCGAPPPSGRRPIRGAGCRR